MPLLPGLHGLCDGIPEGSSKNEETRHFLDERIMPLVDLDSFQDFLWRKSPTQLPISAETVFLSQFRNDPWRLGSMTIDDAWSRLSPRESRRYTARAKKNEIQNTTELAEYNKLCRLSPFVKDTSLVWQSVHAKSVLDMELWQLNSPRLVAWQRWKRYRWNYPELDECQKTNVPERPFRIMDLPFELRREIFSLVLTQSYPVLQFQSDGSADALHGPVDVRLFAVSRQVFAEAVRTFYEVNTLSISTRPSDYLKAMPLFARQSTGTEAPRPTDSVRRVRVSFGFVAGTSMDMDMFRFLWKRFCEVLKTCRSLRTVEVVAQWIIPGVYHEAINLQLDKLAETFMNSRGIGGATFMDVTTYEPFENQLFDNLKLARRIVCITI